MWLITVGDWHSWSFITVGISACFLVVASYYGHTIALVTKSTDHNQNVFVISSSTIFQSQDFVLSLDF